MSSPVLPLLFKGIILFSLPEWWNYAGEISWAGSHVDSSRGAAEGHWLCKRQILGLCHDYFLHWLQPLYLKGLQLVFPAYLRWFIQSNSVHNWPTVDHGSLSDLCDLLSGLSWLIRLLVEIALLVCSLVQIITLRSYGNAETAWKKKKTKPSFKARQQK